MFEELVTDDVIPDSTRRVTSAPGELTRTMDKTSPRMSSADIVMSTQMSNKISTGRKTTDNKQTTKIVTTPEPVELQTTAPNMGMTTAPVVNIDGPVFFNGNQFYSYPTGVTEK